LTEDPRVLDNRLAPRGKVAYAPNGASKTTPEIAMKWSKPSFEDIRFGFEITMYIATR
jgi:coenzyme PQQ precursor peptide PqqA